VYSKVRVGLDVFTGKSKRNSETNQVSSSFFPAGTCPGRTFKEHDDASSRTNLVTPPLPSHHHKTLSSRSRGVNEYTPSNYT
jgi:hypothetical protein